jgi:hypothetical protein
VSDQIVASQTVVTRPKFGAVTAHTLCGLPAKPRRSRLDAPRPLTSSSNPTLHATHRSIAPSFAEVQTTSLARVLAQGRRLPDGYDILDSMSATEAGPRAIGLCRIDVAPALQYGMMTIGQPDLTE